MKLADLNAAVKRYEQQLAAGSESALLGDYNEDMRKACGVVGLCGDPGDAEVLDETAAYWLGAYAAELLSGEATAAGGVHPGKVADAWAQDKLVLPEAARDLWPDYKTGFDERLAALRQIAEASDHVAVLKQGSSYDLNKLKHVGWTDGDGSGCEGYAVDSYFGPGGVYLGPDKHGIEPVFDHPFADPSDDAAVDVVVDDEEDADASDAVAGVQEQAAAAHCLHLKAIDVGFDLRKSGTAVKIPPAESLQAVWDGGSVLGSREAVLAELRKAGFTIAE